MTIWFL